MHLYLLGEIKLDWITQHFVATFAEQTCSFYIPKWSYTKEPQGAMKAAMKWLRKQRS